MFLSSFHPKSQKLCFRYILTSFFSAQHTYIAISCSAVRPKLLKRNFTLLDEDDPFSVSFFFSDKDRLADGEGDLVWPSSGAAGKFQINRNKCSRENYRTNWHMEDFTSSRNTSPVPCPVLRRYCLQYRHRDTELSVQTRPLSLLETWIQVDPTDFLRLISFSGTVPRTLAEVWLPVNLVLFLEMAQSEQG